MALRSTQVKIDYMKASDFMNLELEDVNYSGDMFIFDARFNDDVVSMIVDVWKLGKQYRLVNVLQDKVFYVENCDLQDVSFPEMFEILDGSYGIERIYRIVTDDWEEE